MRIGFMGPSGVGKTTLLEAMKGHERFARHEFNQNVMRKLRDQGHPINEDTVGATQTLAMREFAYGMLRSDRCVNERTVLDCLAYSMMSASMGRMTAAELAEHESVAWTLAPVYDQIFYIAPEFAVRENGLRLTSPEAYRLHVEAFDVLQRRARTLAKVTQLTGTVAHRLEQIERAVGLRTGSLVALAPA